MESRIQRLRELMDEVVEQFFAEGEPYVVEKEGEYLRDVITLYAKQHNLLESILVLLEHNMSEEAYILLRSLLNNGMWIVYLCDDDEKRSRFREYSNQPIINNLYFLNNLVTASKKEWFTNPEIVKENKIDIEQVKKDIKELEKIMKDKGIEQNERRPVSVAKLAKSNDLLFGYYFSVYNDASKYEHSDPATLNFYRNKIMNEYDNDLIFSIDLSKTSEELKEKVLYFAAAIYGNSFMKIFNHFTDKQNHLLDYYDKEKLNSIMIGFYKLNK